jgi:hypothetical protein
MSVSKIIAVDFDGTCVEHRYPEVGPEVLGCVETLRALVNAGHRIILWTIRSGKELEAAVHWFNDREIPLFGVNANPEQSSWSDSRKAYAHLYIDDAALGCPTLQYPPARPYVRWDVVQVFLHDLGYL